MSPTWKTKLLLALKSATQVYVEGWTGEYTGPDGDKPAQIRVEELRETLLFEDQDVVIEDDGCTEIKLLGGKTEHLQLMMLRGLVESDLEKTNMSAIGPNKKDVECVNEVLNYIKLTENRMVFLRTRLAADTEELAKLQTCVAQADKKLSDLMHKMDIANSGNTGYEARMRKFLMLFLPHE